MRKSKQFQAIQVVSLELQAHSFDSQVLLCARFVHYDAIDASYVCVFVCCIHKQTHTHTYGVYIRTFSCIDLLAMYAQNRLEMS